MNEKQAEKFESIRQGNMDQTELITDYWMQYSNINTWQFWLLIFMFIVPLIVLYWRMERQRAFFLGFFGLNVHVWFSYFDTFGVQHGMWGYPYKFMSLLPESITLDTSFVPVAFMLLYQWCIHNRRNFYLFGIGLCAAFSFVLKPIMVQLDLFHMYRGMNFFYLFLFYLAVFGLAIGITKLFVFLRNSDNSDAPKVNLLFLSKRFFSRIKAR
jgi:hypothetical protein